MRANDNAAACDGNTKQFQRRRCSGKRLIALAAVMMSVGGSAARSARAAELVWDGGADANFNWSDGENWVGDLAPAATGDTLAFNGTIGLANTNDAAVTSLVNNATAGRGAITFEAGAGAFALSGTPVSWETDANGRFIYNLSGNDQVLSMDFSDGATGVNGTRDRGISPGAGRTITLNGNINYGNDRLFPEGTAGTIVINGNNTGDGTVATAAGTNSFRSTIRNNIAGTQLQLGSATALGNASTGTFAAGDLAIRGVVGNGSMFVRAGAPLDMSAYGFVINAAGAMNFNGTNNLTVGYLVNQGGNRDFNVSGSNVITVASTGGVFTSIDQTARQLNINLASGGGMVINSPLYTTVHSGGITTKVNSQLGAAATVNGIIRFQNGNVTLNADSSTTFINGEFRSLSGATVKLGHAGAMGDSTTLVDIDNGGTVDLNGITMIQAFEQLDGAGVGGNGALINSNTTTAGGVATDITNVGNFTVGGAGNVELQRVSQAAAVARNITKVGGGTLTLSGATDNTRYGLIVSGGTVNLNKSDIGRAVINNPLVINGTDAVARLTGTGTDQINNADAVQVINGTFDMNGHNETAATLTIGDATTAGSVIGAGSTYTASAGSTIEARNGSVTVNLAGDAALNKTSDAAVTLSGVNTYTGPTVASAGKLVLGKSLTASASVAAENDATIELANDGSHNQIIKTPTVAIGANARIDLRDNKLITDTPVGSFNGTAYTGIQGEVQRAYNFGAWDQPGLTTSMPNAGQNAGILSGTETIAVATAEQVLFISATDTALFQGQTVTGATTIAMYTYAGDLNLDGLVDGADYGVIDNSVQFSGTDGYVNGDCNYDGVIDGADYGITDNTIQLQGAPFPGVVFGAGASTFGASLSGVTAVPEPASLSVVGLAAAGSLLRPRRRRRRLTH